MLDWVDASRSFPSGHSSISWFTAIFCAVSTFYRIYSSAFFRSFVIDVVFQEELVGDLLENNETFKLK